MTVKKIRNLAAFLFALDAAVIAGHFVLGDRIHFFDLDREGNLASLVAGAKLWVLGTLTLLLAIFFSYIKEKGARVWVWTLAALGFIWIGLDDMMGVHERIGFVLNNLFRKGGFYGESFNWLIYYSPFVFGALVVFGMLPFGMWRVARRSALLCAVGFTMWFFSLGLEVLGRYLLTGTSINVSLYHGVLVAEEVLEMVGADFLLIGMVIYFANSLRAHVVLR